MQIKSRQPQPSNNQNTQPNRSKRFIFMLVTATVIGAFAWGMISMLLDADAYNSFEGGMQAKRENNMDLAARRFAKAETSMRGALEARKKDRGQFNAEVANDETNLARVLAEEGKDAEAESLFKQSLAVYDKFGQDALIDHVGAMSHYCDFLTARGRYQDAEPILQQALAALKAAKSPYRTETAWTLQRLAAVYTNTGRPEQARSANQQANELLSKHG